MRDYDEKSYYEIQLDNKQLILVFLAAVTVCVLIFVLGVMIGKGQKEAEYAATSQGEKNLAAAEPDSNTPQQAVPDITSEAPAQEEKPTLKEPVAAKQEAAREEPKAQAKEKSKEPLKVASKTTPEVKKAETKQAEVEKAKDNQDTKGKYAYEDLDKKDPAPDVEKEIVESAEPESASAKASEDPKVSGNSRYTVQVMATSSKPKAQEQVSRLKSRGYKPFMDESKSGEVSVFKVRVGRFVDTEEAKVVATRIKNDLKLETWVAVLD